MQYNKLVRDHIPKVLDEKGIPNKYHIADAIEFEEKLFHKLLEEAKEVVDDRNVDELADIYEILDAIKKLKGFSDEEIEKAQTKKREEKGGFEKHVILEES